MLSDFKKLLLPDIKLQMPDKMDLKTTFTGHRNYFYRTLNYKKKFVVLLKNYKNSSQKINDNVCLSYINTNVVS